MKQILINSKTKKIILEEIPAPICKDEGVLIRTQYSLISTGTELAPFRQPETSYFRKIVTDKTFYKKTINFIKTQGVKKTINRINRIRDRGEFFPTGYSGAGIIVEVGGNIKDLKIGDRVAYGGSRHAEIVYTPRNLVVKIPGGMEFKEAAFMTLGSIAIQGIRRAQVEFGETALVIGLGLVGQLVCQLLKVAGCHTIGNDLSKKRIEIATKLGLEKGVDMGGEGFIKEIKNYTDQIGVDAVIICAQSPSSEIINQAMKVCRERGRVIIVGDVGLNLERQPFYLNELDLRISRAYGPGVYDKNYTEKGIDYPIGYVRWTANRNMEEFLRLVSENKVNIKNLITEFNIEDVQTAYESLLSGKEEIIGVVLNWGNQAKVISPRTVTISKKKNERDKDKVNIAIMGAGGISKGFHLPNLKKRKAANIYAICDIDGVNARKTAEKYKTAYCTTDYKEILRNKEVDCVLIATRHNLHKEMVINSAKAGKHIYVEKPLAMNYEDIKEIIKVVKDTGIILTVGTNRRYSPLSVIAKEVIRKKNKPVIINYRVNTTTLPLGHWVNDPIEGGGRIIGEAPHFFDWMYWLLDSEPIRIYAEKVESDKKNIIKENNIVSTIKFADGSIASLSYCDFGSLSFSREMIEIFSGGTVIKIDDFREIETSDGLHKKYNFSNLGLYEAMANFIEVLQGKKILELGVEDGARSTICALKLLDSLRIGKPADINLEDYLRQ